MNMASILQFVEGRKIVFFMFLGHNHGFKEKDDVIECRSARRVL